jgi:hypothetical protein
MRSRKREGDADLPGGARHAGLWQLADVDLWRRTCGAVLNEVRRVLIVLSKLVVNGAFTPMPDYSRSYEKQYKGRGLSVPKTSSDRGWVRESRKLIG